MMMTILPSPDPTPTPDGDTPRFPAWLRGLAQGLSVVFHPLFVPLAGTWFLIAIHPYRFAAFSDKMIFRLYVLVITYTLVLPALTVFLLRKMDFISSIFMKTRQDRIIPYVAVMTFYFWTYFTLHARTGPPEVLTTFLLGNFIAVVIAFVGNLRTKVSMHALGLGGLLGLVLNQISDPHLNMSLPLLAVILLTGVVSTCRMILGAHSLREIYLAVMIGIVAQLLAAWIQ